MWFYILKNVESQKKNNGKEERGICEILQRNGKSL
jgi:hypothetical protein